MHEVERPVSGTRWAVAVAVALGIVGLAVLAVSAAGGLAAFGWYSGMP